MHTASVLRFVTLAYGISWLIWSPYYLPFFPKEWAFAPFFHFAGCVGPFLAALIITAKEKGYSGVLTLLKSAFLPGTHTAYVLLALAFPIAALLAAYPFLGRPLSLSQIADTLSHNKELAISAPVWFLFNIIVYGMGEEGGWRGYALPGLQRQMGALQATLLLTAIWMLWHWPLFFYVNSSYSHMGGGDLAGWAFSMLTGSVIFTWLFNSSRGSVLACAVFHGSMDVAFTADPSTSMQTFQGVVVTLAGVAILVAYPWRRLSHNPPATSPA